VLLTVNPITVDWVADAPVNKAAWATYRQALRDLPAQGGIADAAEFPVAP
jgi:hypothetical protein